jgi:hypothetical protein
MQRGALSRHFAKSHLSAEQTQDICLFGCTAHDALAAIRTACARAIEQGGAISPESLLAFLSDNQLLLEETTHGQNGGETQEQGIEPSGATDA